jgi:hypothetical protein
MLKLNSSLDNLGIFWRCAEFLANVFGRILPTIPFVERHVADEYLCLVERPVEVENRSDTQNLALYCPSYPVTSSARIIAKRRSASRSFSFLNKPALVPANILGLKQLDMDSGNVRLSGRCITKFCAHWTGSTCRLGSAISNVQLRARPPKSCPIRESCRWNFENPDSACRSCKFLPYSKLLNLIPN